MGFRFHKRIRILPGVHLNLSKSGLSLSVGPRGAKMTIGSSGVRGTVGIPGTGLSYTKKLDVDGDEKSGDKPNLFEQLTASPQEEAFVNGLREYVAGNIDAAQDQLQNALHLADGAFVAGVLALQKGDLAAAQSALNQAMGQQSELGQLFAKYKIAAKVGLEITEELEAQIEPSVAGVTLALAEVAQAQGNVAEAIQWLEKLYQAAPDDLIVRLSLAELLIESSPDQATYQRVMQLAEGVQNDSPIHTALLLYRAKALRGLNMPDPAKTMLTEALRRKKDRSPELLLALRYERALCLEALGDAAGAKKDFQAIYAEAPTYEDVAARLGLK